MKHENRKRGVNRLFLVLTFGWAICCAVLYPLQRQWEGQHEALIKYGKDVKNCDQLVAERPGWALTKNCYEDASSMGIPVKVNAHSGGKPNGIPVKMNSSRSAATLTS